MTLSNLHRTSDIPTQIKNPDLVERRRKQIADAAVRLFIVYGFEKTTTRQIAKAARLSIGSLYEYFATKEDVLYLVLDSIYIEIENAIQLALTKSSGGEETLVELIRQYLLACHRLSDYMLLLYQETHNLPKEWRSRVLKSDLNITGAFEKVLKEIFAHKAFSNNGAGFINLTAHNIVVFGHMWTFRRWALAREHTLEEYIQHQTDLILALINQPGPSVKN
ncbi:MAG: TetR/AcrR family transcriptional regulator, partial [Proteobacteria bacterium]|nr:TetR/AcrR family transcriptional regulator [Pseudomonadota bacterium]